MRKFTLLLLVFIIKIAWGQILDPNDPNFNYHTKILKNQPLHNAWEKHEVPPVRKCGTMDYYKMELEADPARGERLRKIEEDSREWIKNNQDYLNSGKLVITIPVVFHIVYNTTAQNVSDQQIMSQLTVMNQDFRNTNSDGSNVPSVFQSLRADPEIEFCLATIDPQGNPTTGITRTQTSVTAFSTNNNVKYTSQGGKDIWDRNKYLNIWVCNMSGGILGYAQFPGGTAATDGVVITYQGFGTMGTAQSPFNKGRTATHEIGHWLNLYHIWGDDNGACTGTDYCDDTPNSGNYYFGCPNHPQTSCNSTDMFMNYMDYVDDACMIMFTHDQKARMVAALNGPRSGLLTSNGCQGGTGPGAPNADFTANVTNIPVGGTVNYTDLSTNTPTSWSWTFNGGTPGTSTQQNPSGVIYNTAGTYTVSLTATNAQGSDTETKTNYITVTSGTTIAPVADFTANVTNIPAGGSVNFSDLSANVPTSWNWTFNGGTPATSTQQNPSNISFNTPGLYTIVLTVTNSAGSDTHTKTDYINVVAGNIAPIADFIGIPTTVPVGGNVNFTDLSSNFPTTWSWTFAGGTPATSTIQNPSSIAYSAVGTYPVSLTVSNSIGTDTHTKNAYIEVIDATGPSGYCDTLNFPLNGTPALYYSPAGHYATGTNEFNDKAKAQYFDSFAPYYKVMGGLFKFGAAKGSTSSVTFGLWDNSGTNGKPSSNPLAVKSLPINSIINNVNSQQLTLVLFDNPVNVTGPFYLGVEIPTTPGDTIALVSNSSGEGGNPCTAWEQWTNNQWYDFATSWGGNLNVKLAIYPIICLSAGIDDVELNKISIYPNPTKDILTIDFIDATPNNVNFKIYNSIGTMVKSVESAPIEDFKFSFDLRNLSSGMYHLHVQTEKGSINYKFSVIK